MRTDTHFFSSRELKRFAATGSPPELPPGITPAEKRGRTFLVDAPFTPPSKNGICALCHSGPMLNTANQAHSNFVGGNPPPGLRFFSTGVNIVNEPNNPTSDAASVRQARAFFANQFKIPTLWGLLGPNRTDR